MAPRAVRRPPTRSCVACRTSRDKHDLIRVVRRPDGTVQTDPTGKANGRGAYVCKDAACITNGIERGTLARALETRIPAGLREELVARIETMSIEGGARGQE